MKLSLRSSRLFCTSSIASSCSLKLSATSLLIRSAVGTYSSCAFFISLPRSTRPAAMSDMIPITLASSTLPRLVAANSADFISVVNFLSASAPFLTVLPIFQAAYAAPTPLTRGRSSRTVFSIFGRSCTPFETSFSIFGRTCSAIFASSSLRLFRATLTLSGASCVASKVFDTTSPRSSYPALRSSRLNLCSRIACASDAAPFLPKVSVAIWRASVSDDASLILWIVSPRTSVIVLPSATAFC